MIYLFNQHLSNTFLLSPTLDTGDLKKKKSKLRSLLSRNIKFGKKEE